MKLLILSLLLFLCNVGMSQENLNIHPDLLPHLNKDLAPFYHGVASGDPTESSIILWTKVSLNKEITSAAIQWEVSESEDFKKTVRKGKILTADQYDFIIKPDVTGLKPNTQYYYRFHYNSKYSLTGQFKTLPRNAENLDIAFASCSNFEWGFFNNYLFIAEDTTIDLVVHLGDYIYEYGVGGYGDTSLHRRHVPAYEIKTLDDYRTRYSLYRLDKDLMKAHQMKAFVTTWDDHESANNAYNEGAQNHQEDTEGKWSDRASAARKAYYEWLPVRKRGEEPLYRSFSVGSLLNLIILDTRLGGRTVQMDMDNPEYGDDSRTILGKEQYAWFSEEVSGNHRWKIIGNQVPFGPMYLPDSVRGIKYMDGWDGYPHEQRKVQEMLKQIDNVVFVTGDFHRSFALENHPDGEDRPEENVAVEFVVTSITSANADEYNPEEEVQRQNDTYLEYNRHMKYANSKDHGFLVLSISKDQIEARFVYATDVHKPEAESFVGEKFVVKKGEKTLSKLRQ